MKAIEALVRHIESKGYQVRVMPGVLYIRKEVNSEVYGLSWIIHRDDFSDLDHLFKKADDFLNQMESDIVERQAKLQALGCLEGKE